MSTYPFGISLLAATLWFACCTQSIAQTVPIRFNTEPITEATTYQHLDTVANSPSLHSQTLQLSDNSDAAHDTNKQQQNPLYLTEDYMRRGIVINPNRIRISSRIDAVISKIHVAAGDPFKKNDVLLEFDCSIERAALEEARLSHQIAKFNYETKQNEVQDISSSSPQTLELLKLKTESALSRLNHIRERIENCRLLAPFDGRVIRILVYEHEAANALAPVMEITDAQPLHFRVFLPWTWLQWLAIGNIMEVTVMNQNYPAELVSLSQEIDPLDQSVKAILKFQSSNDLVIGMHGVVQFRPPPSATLQYQSP